MRAKKLFREKKLVSMNWPAKSPYLNRIENLCSILVRRIYNNARNFNHTTYVKRGIHENWEATDRSVRTHLVQRINMRCIAVSTNAERRMKY